jgi:endonuclease YncB( thermonuclease family)
MKKYCYLLLIVFISCNTVKYEKVIRCLDGDTIVTESNTHVRLSEIDALELHQPHGIEAKLLIERLILNRTVKLVFTGTDKYNRKIAEIYLNGVYINEEIVKSGQAYVYRRFGSSRLYNDELQAKRNRIGIWAYNTQPPYLFRRDHKHSK